MRTQKSSADEQAAAEEQAQPEQAEEGGRRRRRGGRHRDRERGERTPREVREAPTEEAHAGQAADDQKGDGEKPLAAPEIAASGVETSALVLGSSALEAPAVSQPGEEPSAEPLLILPPLHASTASASESEASAEPATTPVKPVSPDTEFEPVQPAARQERSTNSPDSVLEPAAAGPVAIASAPTPFLERDKVEAREAQAEADPAAEAVSMAKQEEDRLSAPGNEPEPLNLDKNGLIMIETIPEKVKPASNDEEVETALPPRRRRQPPPVILDQQEPLVQVETQK